MIIYSPILTVSADVILYLLIADFGIAVYLHHLNLC